MLYSITLFKFVILNQIIGYEIINNEDDEEQEVLRRKVETKVSKSEGNSKIVEVCINQISDCNIASYKSLTLNYNFFLKKHSFY